MAARADMALAAFVALAACSPRAPTDEDRAPAASEAPVTAPAAVASAPSSATATPASATAEPRYVGRWAAREDLCRTGAWTFTGDHLATAGEVSCDFTKVREVPGGYDIAATCTAEGPPRADTFTLRFAESAKAMLVEGSSVLADTGLIRCGES